MARGTSAKLHPPLKIRYFKRMKSQKVYPVQVTWKTPPSKAKGAEPYTVRLVVPGAQVVPSERILSPGKPKEKAVFYVTPLAKRGQLRGERLEVLQDGEKVQEVATPSKVSSLKWVWIFLLLAILVPYVIGEHVQTHKVPTHSKDWNSYTARLDKFTAEYIPHPNTTKTNTPIKDIVKDNKKINKDLLSYYTVAAESLITDVCLVTPADSDGSVIYKLYIPFWFFVLFVFFAFLAWWFGREKRSTRVSKPLAIKG